MENDKIVTISIVMQHRIETSFDEMDSHWLLLNFPMHKANFSAIFFILRIGLKICIVFDKFFVFDG